MRPDFPIIKAELHRMLELGASVEQPRQPETFESVLMLPRQPNHEGDHAVLVRETGEEVEVPLHKYTASELIDLSDGGLPTLAATYKKYCDLASNTNDQVTVDVGKLKASTAESIGKLVKLGGRPLEQGIMEGIEQMHLLTVPSLGGTQGRSQRLYRRKPADSNEALSTLRLALQMRISTQN